MEAFKAGRIQPLVATTVIEVGVDVPNASLMVVEHAERFGLSQPHQLRGRVGRGADESVCILLYEHPLSDGARTRLKVIYEHTDGFRIAHEDTPLLRGPGEYLGARQSGVPLLRFADLVQDEDLVQAARATAELMLDRYPAAATAHVALAGRTDGAHGGLSCRPLSNGSSAGAAGEEISRSPASPRPAFAPGRDNARHARRSVSQPHRPLRATDAARQADRHAAPPLAHAVGGVDRRGRRRTGSPSGSSRSGRSSCARPAAW